MLGIAVVYGFRLRLETLSLSVSVGGDMSQDKFAKNMLAQVFGRVDIADYLINPDLLKVGGHRHPEWVDAWA